MTALPGSPAGTRVVSPALVGRSHELELLVSAVATPPGVAVVEGEAGIGKTRLIAELRGHPRLAGRRFAGGYCHPIREPFPLGPVLEAARSLREHLPPDRLSPVAGALQPLLPELADRLPPRPEPLGNRVAERHRVFRGLVELLESASPVTVVLEDLHWADEHTLDFLRYLLRDPPGSLSLVITFRSEEVDPAVRALPATATRAHVVLPPLDLHQTGQLAAAIVSTECVSDDFAAYLCERTGGLPFAIEEVMALLQERGVMALRGHRWPRRTLDELAVPTAVRDHVLERAGRLPAPARSMMEAVAVLQHPAPEDLIAAVSRRSPAELASGLSQAMEFGLLVDGSDGMGFRHALAAQAVYHDIPGPRRRELHNRAAAAVRERAPELLGQLAHHLRHAGRLDEWAATAERAADQADALGNYDEAGRLLEDILRHRAADPAVAGRVAVKLGWAAIEMVRIAQLPELLSQVLELDLPRPVRGELRYLLGALLDRTSLEPARMDRLLRHAIQDLDDRPDLRARAMVALAMRGSAPDSFARRKQLLDRALATLPAIGDPAFEVFLLGKVAGMLVDMGDQQWRELLDRIETQTGGEARHRYHANAYSSVGATASFVGHHQSAARLLKTALVGAGGCGNRRLEATVRTSLAVLDYCRGAWDGLAEEVAALPEELTDHPRCLQLVDAVAGGLALARGDLAASAGRLAPVADRMEASSFSVALAVATLVRVELARGDLGAALTATDRYLAGQGPDMLWPVSFRALPWLVEALTAAGSVAQARTVVFRHARGLRGIAAPLAPAALRHAQGFVAAADGAPDRAAGYFLAAALRYDRLHSRYEAAQAREHAARALVAAGQPERVAEPLAAALATYERLGARWDLARAARIARLHGVSVPARHRGGHRGYGTALSPREREVAELAATGRTNKEIAAELFLSAETVKKHLQAGMRKLGVQSRAALAHRLPHATEVAGVSSTPFGE
ncbi:MAG: AAA family ATPase [Micromonosporaceae bacterium]|nr:AAA family ATPase [Micromonosporaceae bacterium]